MRQGSAIYVTLPAGTKFDRCLHHLIQSPESCNKVGELKAELSGYIAINSKDEKPIEALFAAPSFEDCTARGIENNYCNIYVKITSPEKLALLPKHLNSNYSPMLYRSAITPIDELTSRLPANSSSTVLALILAVFVSGTVFWAYTLFKAPERRKRRRRRRSARFSTIRSS